MDNRYEAIRFRNGEHAVNTNYFNILVEAPRRLAHGDTKTQMSRTEFMGMEKGERGIVVSRFHNLYGDWARVIRESDFEVVDTRFSELEYLQDNNWDYVEFENGYKRIDFSNQDQKIAATIMRTGTDRSGLKNPLTMSKGFPIQSGMKGTVVLQQDYPLHRARQIFPEDKKKEAIKLPFFVQLTGDLQIRVVNSVDLAIDHDKGMIPLGHLNPKTVPLTGYNDMVDSTSDDRTKYNVMRHEYRVLTDAEKDKMKDIKDMGLEFHDFLSEIGDSRELSLAKTKIEEAVMWAVKHITK